MYHFCHAILSRCHCHANTASAWLQSYLEQIPTPLPPRSCTYI